MRRASWTGEGAGKIDRPGGHPEPDDALKVKEFTIIYSLFRAILLKQYQSTNKILFLISSQYLYILKSLIIQKMNSPMALTK